MNGWMVDIVCVLFTFHIYTADVSGISTHLQTTSSMSTVPVPMPPGETRSAVRRVLRQRCTTIFFLRFLNLGA